MSEALTNRRVPTPTANPTQPASNPESDRTFGSPLDPYTRGGGQFDAIALEKQAMEMRLKTVEAKLKWAEMRLKS